MTTEQANQLQAIYEKVNISNNYNNINTITHSGSTYSGSSKANYKFIFVSQIGTEGYTSFKINNIECISKCIQADAGNTMLVPISGNVGDTISLVRTSEYGTNNITMVN